MRLLLDTHLLLWLAAGSPRAEGVRAIVEAPDADPLFSVASLWEVAIKASLGREDFRVDAARLRLGLARAGFEELSVRGEHAIEAGRLPLLHRDPFDRMLIAQARTESCDLFTADRRLAGYGEGIRLV